MKSKFLLPMALLAAAASFTACDDDDDLVQGEYSLDRLYSTMFRNEHTTGIKDSDPTYAKYNIHSDGNTLFLYWFGVEGAYGYEVKVGLQSMVSTDDADVWGKEENLVFHKVFRTNGVPQQAITGGAALQQEELLADRYECTVPYLQYQSDYRCAIRVLHSGNLTDPQNSRWYGYASGREWVEQAAVSTKNRYSTPPAIFYTDKTTSGMILNINRRVDAQKNEELVKEYRENFEIKTDQYGNEVYVMDRVLVEPSASNLSAQLPAGYDAANGLKLTDDMFSEDGKCQIQLTGMSENSLYVINVENVGRSQKTCKWDGVYNTLTVRTSGQARAPIFVKHYCNKTDQVYRCNAGTNYTNVPFERVGDTIPGAIELNACRLDTVIKNFQNDSNLPEGQIFYLEGNKTYYMAGTVSLCKGMTLMTLPEDLKAGKRARIIHMEHTTQEKYAGSSPTFFMFGRNPQVGEMGFIDVDAITFEGIDFDFPYATNFGFGMATGNYLINMYSQGMAVVLKRFAVRDCSFQGIVRGFIRTQGPNPKNFHELIVDNNIFYNCGYHDNNGGGYAWIHGDGNNVATNIYENFQWTNNTIYDSPKGNLVTDSGKNLDWQTDNNGKPIAWNLNVSNNTFVNYATRAAQVMFNLSYIPNNSTVGIKNNLWVQARADADSRAMNLSGMDLRTVNGAGNAITIDIKNNYHSTSANIDADKYNQEDGCWSAAAFSASSNSAGKFDNPDAYQPGVINGADQLKIHWLGVTPEELMGNPCPNHYEDGPDYHIVGSSLAEHFFENTGGKDGLGVDVPHSAIQDKLMYKDASKGTVNGEPIGDQRWTRGKGNLWSYPNQVNWVETPAQTYEDYIQEVKNM